MSDSLPGLPPADPGGRAVALTLGSFDGVHRGHVRLIRRLRSEAARRDADAVALTFDPHPRCVVGPSGCPPMLTGVEERLQLLREAGADRAHAVRFDRELSGWSAERFVAALAAHRPLRALVAGPGFALGHGRAGDLAFLRRAGGELGFNVIEVPPLRMGGEPVSSTRIRTALNAGRAGEARALLGREYSLPGTVVEGRRVGRLLGYPTANLRVPTGRCLPALGIYAARLHVDGRGLAAAASVGTNPTFGTNTVTVEAFVLDFDGDLYGKEVRMSFVRRLRNERRFPTEAALSRQMALDVERTRRVLRK